jgi:hypothetical protein
MIQSNSFRFDHEAGDEPSVRESLTRFRQMGIKLGATVTVWSCDSCNVIEAIFTSPPAGPSA